MVNEKSQHLNPKKALLWMGLIIKKGTLDYVENRKLELTWIARNIMWIQVRGLRVLILKKFCPYKQCSPLPKQTKCSLQ